MQPHHAYYIPLGHSYPGAPKQISLEHALGALKPVMEDRAIRKIGQNIKYDLLVLGHYGIQVKGVSFDTMIASYLLNPGKASHSLDALALEYFNHKTITYADVTGSGKKQIGFDEVDVPTATRYSGEDADLTLRLKQMLAPLLREQNLERLFLDMEMPLMEVLVDMERTGVKINADFLKLMSNKLGLEMAGIERTIYELAGTEFNINSPKQLAEILFVKLKTHADQKDQDRVLDQCRRARRAGPGPSPAGRDPEIPYALEAQVDLYRRAAVDDQPENGKAPHIAQPDRDRDRQAFEQRAEPSEHPHTHRGGAGDQTGVHRRTRSEPALGRLLPDRAARPRPHEQRPGTDQDLSER